MVIVLEIRGLKERVASNKNGRPKQDIMEVVRIGVWSMLMILESFVLVTRCMLRVEMLYVTSCPLID